MTAKPTVDDAVDTYKELSQFPEVKAACISNKATSSQTQVTSYWSQRDLSRKENVSFIKNYLVQADTLVATQPQEIAKVQLSAESLSGEQQAIIRKVSQKSGEDKQFIEIWSNSQKTHNIDVETLEEHGKIYGDATFGCLEWSYGETHILYIAEKRRPKGKSYFEQKPTSEESKDGTESKGEEFVFHDDWGEQLTGKSHSMVCLLELRTETVRVLDSLPDDVSAGNAVWCPDDSGVLCVGSYHGPYRLGMIYCAMRRSALFYVDLKSNKYDILGADDQSVASPVFSPDQSKLIYLENNAGGPHMHCRKLKMCDWSTKQIVTLVDQVRNTTNKDEFPGLFVLHLPRRCWANDSKRIILDTHWRSKSELIVVNSETNRVTRLTNDDEVGSWTVLDVHNNILLAKCSSPCQPQHMVQGHLPSVGKEPTITWISDQKPLQIQGVTWSVEQMDVSTARANPQFADLTYEYIVIEPQNRDVTKKSPMIIFPHGGPHSAFVAELMLYPACLCRLGYIIVCVNYRGSIGFGQDSVESLPGRVGTQDVQDVQAVAEKVRLTHNVDPSKVYVMGGSHGGFLTLHLIGQYPEFYKAAIVRNPVTNIASMVGATDIIDWTFVEAGLPDFSHKTVATPEMYTKSWNMSPIRYVDQVKTPVLLCVGLDDRRVPPKQANEYRTALAARGVPVKMLCYPENAHPIIKVDSEADCFINIVKWYREHTTE